jgi:kynureninase
MTDMFDRSYAVGLDHADELKGFQDKFSIPMHGAGSCIYLCGNSLGLQPTRARRLVAEVMDHWQALGVKGHLEGKRPWLPYHEFLTNLTAQLVNAQPREVVTMNTLTVNLHLMMVSFYRPTATRNRIVIEQGAFPSDRYAVESQIVLWGHDPKEALVELGPREGETLLRHEDIEAYLKREGERVALVLLPGVQYYTGQRFDLKRLSKAAHAAGARVGFDLAHAVGNVPLDLHDDDCDFAVWCSYKYLNGGPGAVAGAFVHERHLESADLPRLHGWWGHDKERRFLMEPAFKGIPSAEGWQLSNPPILSLAPVLASLEIFSEAGMGRLRAKSERLTGYLEQLLDARLAGRVEIITPRTPAERGCQLSIRVLGVAIRGMEGRRVEGKAVFERLEGSGVVCDWREPDVVRVAPVPLYNTFEDVRRFVQRLEDALG